MSHFKLPKFTARCLVSEDCTAVMHEPECRALRANLRAPLDPPTAESEGSDMSDPPCSFVLPDGGSCRLTASTCLAWTFSSAWAPPLRDATGSADYCTLHSRVMSTHIRSNMPSHWVRLTETLLSAVGDLPALSR